MYSQNNNGSVAQLNRASDYGSEGWGFESLRNHRKTFSKSAKAADFLFYSTLQKNHAQPADMLRSAVLYSAKARKDEGAKGKHREAVSCFRPFVPSRYFVIDTTVDLTSTIYIICPSALSVNNTISYSQSQN